MSGDWQKIPLDAGVFARVVTAMAAVVVSVIAIQYWVDTRIDDRALASIERNVKIIHRVDSDIRDIRQRLRRVEIQQRREYYDGSDQSFLLQPDGHFWHANGRESDTVDGGTSVGGQQSQ